MSPTKKQLTPGQKDVADAFFKFLLSDDTEFVLSGDAGTGKTFLMEYLSNETMLTYERSCAIMDIEPKQYQIHFTATTNKAAEVLERSVQKPVDTIHSFLGLRVFDDYKTGKQVIRPGGASLIHTDIILFIDEASMIDAELKGYIDRHVRDSKIVYVGDKAQLAPVGEDLSPVFKTVDPKNFFHLTQVVRNANAPALMRLCAQLRHTVQTGVFYHMDAAPGVIDYLDDSGMQQMLDDYFLEPGKSARILCYTNSRVKTFNEYVREIRNLPAKLTAGETAVVARNYAHGKNLLNVEREVEILDIEPTIYTSTYPYQKDNTRKINFQHFRVQPRASFMGPMTIRVPQSIEDVEMVMKSAKQRKDWDTYFTLKNSFVDLRGKEACTVYKSQGSTYDTVFVDLGNIGTSWDPEQVARMLFVAVSRATTRVFFYGQLPGKYQGRTTYDPNTHANSDAAMAAE